MDLKIKKEHKNFKMPTKATQGSAGFDCYVADYFFSDGSLWYNLGFSMELPEGYFALVISRSSIVKTSGIQANCVGVIDTDYRGIWHFVMRPLNKWSEQLIGEIVQKEDNLIPYNIGDRCCQFFVLPILDITLSEHSSLTSTNRNGGFGSTGK